MSAYGACAYDIHLYTSCYKKNPQEIVFCKLVRNNNLTVDIMICVFFF